VGLQTTAGGETTEQLARRFILTSLGPPADQHKSVRATRIKHKATSIGFYLFALIAAGIIFSAANMQRQMARYDTPLKA
jgi:hypothetical protein